MLIYLLPIDCLNWSQNDSYLLNFVSADRQNKIQHYINPIDQKLSLYAFLIAKMILSKLTGLAHQDILFSTDSHNKPICSSFPNYHFNYSHTHNAVLCCASSESPVGADIERIRNAPYDIMDFCFHPDEINYVEKESCDSEIRFFQVWTRKESYTKYLGTGLTENLSKVNTMSPDIAPLFHTWKQGGYICSICSKSQSSFRLFQLSFKDIWNYFCYCN